MRESCRWTPCGHLVGGIFCFGLGFSIFGSIACVEKRHAAHRRIADPKMQWRNFAALSVTGEAQRLHDARVATAEHALPVLASAPVADTREADSQAAVVVARVPPRKILKAKSAFKLFHARWLESEQVLGRRWNPAAAQTWTACRRAFDELEDAERETYRIEAAATVQQAKANRAEVASLRRASEQGAVQQPEQQEVQAVQQLQLQDVQAAQQPEQQEGQSMASLVPLGAAFACRCDLAATSDSSAVAVQQPPEPDSYPVEPCDLEKYFSLPREDGLPARKARQEESRWNQHTTRIAPAAGPDDLPAKATYPRPCGALCWHASTVRERRLHRALREKFGHVAVACSPTGKAAAVALGEVVLMFELFDSPGILRPPDGIKFFALTDAAGKFSGNPDVQMFTKLVVERGEVECNIKLLPTTTSTSSCIRR